MKGKDLIRVRHVWSLIKYLEQERKGLHVTDIVYGCPYYAKWASTRGREERRNIDEQGLIRLSVGKLLDTLDLGDWHHVKLTYGDLQGEIDDIVELDGTLWIVDKKTVVEKPPREAHSHYVTQVQTYMVMLKHGTVVSCEKGDLEELLKKVRTMPLKGAILYVDVSASTRTMVSDVVEVPAPAPEFEDWLEWMLFEVEKEKPEKVVSWFCHYCPIMNTCWGEEANG
ncbi:MAG: PD-(D/E)XK nuclease family protein [Candidatus Caldarchaeum sp.]